MQEFITNNYKHILFVMLLISRLSDIGTTYAATPKLMMEANPLVRKFRWKFAWITTLIVCFSPYVSPGLAIAIIVASFLVSASNASKIWIARALGEEKMHALFLDAAGKSNPRSSLFFITLPAIFFLILAGSLFYAYPDPHEFAYFFACGIFAYAIAILVHIPRFYFKMRKLALNP